MGRCHITQGAGAPTSTPQGAGDHYTDTSNGDVYISTGSSTPADWRRISETLTTLALNTNSLDYTDENGVTTNIDLSLYIDDTNLARLVSGTINPATGIATFTRDDATTFNIDFSSLIDIETVTTLTESPAGVFKYTSEDATETTIDISNFETSTELDLRDTANRDRSNHTGTQTASTISDFAAQVAIDETDTTIALIGNTLRYIGEDGTNQDIDLSPYIDDTNLARITSGSLNPATGILTLTRDDATDFTIDLSALKDAETITTLTESPVGVFTYTSEDATQTIIDISDFETSTELDARDTANRDRANHTGTQTASTISDFDTEVSNNTDVAANTAARHASGSDNQNLFETISVPNGTNPVADTQTDTLNFTSSDSTVIITGNATTDTVDFTVVPVNAGLETKAGFVLGDSFFNASGQRVYDLTFATAFADANYAISLTSTVERVLTYTSKTATGFRIETNSNTSINGESFDWVATKYGET